MDQDDYADLMRRADIAAQEAETERLDELAKLSDDEFAALDLEEIVIQLSSDGQRRFLELAQLRGAAAAVRELDAIGRARQQPKSPPAPPLPAPPTPPVAPPPFRRRSTASAEASAAVFGGIGLGMVGMAGTLLYGVTIIWPQSAPAVGWVALALGLPAAFTLWRICRPFWRRGRGLLMLGAVVIAAATVGAGSIDARTVTTFLLDRSHAALARETVASVAVQPSAPVLLWSADLARSRVPVPANAMRFALAPDSQYRVAEIGIGAIRIEEEPHRLLALHAQPGNTMLAARSNGPRMTGWVSRDLVILHHLP